MRKLKAFTLLEVLIAMVISTLVIGAGFVGYEFTMKQYYAFRENSTVMSDACIFQSVLKKDICLARRVSLTSYGLSCNTQEKFIRYDFKRDYVLRINENDMRDTFHIKNDSLSLLYNNLVQIDPGKQIDRISFRIDLHGELQSVVITKEYGADGVINDLINERRESGRY
jgi:prepilin-type N-terminal cleavage/methylation domain-containing protein